MSRFLRRPPTLSILLAVLVTGSSCSVRKFAVNKVGDALASGGAVYESDEDLELVGDALPFSLKLVESLLAESPRHRGLLLTACKGFTSYAYIYVENEADVTAVDDLASARGLRIRARKLYLRAHAYGLRGLETSYPGLGDALLKHPEAAAARVSKKKDVPLLYWTAAALGLAISVSRNDPALLARLPEVDALLGRALGLNESWEDGTLHEFEIVFSGARPGRRDDEALQAHFERALLLSKRRRAGLYVSYAEAFAVPRQDGPRFQELLEKALAIDPDAYEAIRLANLVAQRRARWLLERKDDLILPVASPASHGGVP